jgi:16S rRNA A1518/A1519 N6-dimethyltransferase RsmA/KsgA/DIM1 with predicted DNA glycosylase/AP lyase activity
MASQLLLLLLLLLWRHQVINAAGAGSDADACVCFFALCVQVEAALKKAGVRPDARAQDLDVEQFAALYNNLQAELVAAVAAAQQ